MNSLTQSISFSSRGLVSLAKSMAALLIGVAGVAGFAASARADNVYWSVGVGSPGVTIGMTNARPLPIFVQPQPYYGQPAPVYVQPGLIYSQPGVIYTQQVPIYVQPSPIYRSGWMPQGRGYDMGPMPMYDRRGDDRGHGHGHGYGYGHGHGQPGYGHGR